MAVKDLVQLIVDVLPVDQKFLQIDLVEHTAVWFGTTGIY